MTLKKRVCRQSVIVFNTSSSQTKELRDWGCFKSKCLYNKEMGNSQAYNTSNYATCEAKCATCHTQISLTSA